MNLFFLFSIVMGSAGLSVIYVLCLFVVCMRQDQDRNENFGNLGATNNNDNRSLQGSRRPLAINYESSSSSSVDNYRQEIQPLILQFSSSSSSINIDSHITSRWCSVGWFSFGPYPWRKKIFQTFERLEKPISNLEKLWIIWSPMKIIIDLKLNPWFCNYNCFLA